MQEKIFIPFADLNSYEDFIVVDGQHNRGLILSHWKGANTNPQIAADSSGEIVLNAIQQKIEGIDIPYITATHFDIDGFVGVWALFEPKLAMQYEEVLRRVAVIGDFRHFNQQDQYDLEALKLVCWINAVEKKEFYIPFGSDSELEDCVSKFEYFLPKFKEIVLNLDKFKEDWEPEYDRVLSDIAADYKHRAYPKLGLWVNETAVPRHYYALFGPTTQYDIVLNLYEGQRYELEFKYTTWVDIVSRPTLPRINMQPLVESLNAIEKSDYQWFSDKITDTGPILRLEDRKLAKAERYAQPFSREIYASSIPPQQFEELVVHYLKTSYAGLKAKRFWSWKELRALNYSPSSGL